MEYSNYGMEYRNYGKHKIDKQKLDDLIKKIK
jgi:hypothetical protein